MSIFWVWIMVIITIFRPSAEDVVEQTRAAMIVTEGNPILIQCFYEADWSVTNDPFWYIQLPGEPPKFFLSEDENRKQGFQVSHIVGENKRSGTFNLKIAASQLDHSAFYLCAFTYGGGSSKLTFGAGTKLNVIPNLEDSEPSVYQLEPKAESKESSDIAACLITDYSPGPINVKYNSSLEPVAINDSAVVVNEDGNKQSASLGVVIWSKNKDQFQCSATYKERLYQAKKEGDATCKETSSDTPAFETDERLNLLSLTVLGLRLIFFKGVALNLILTFWAWSR